MDPAGPIRILVVDDDRDTEDTLERLLALHGYDVRVAYNGPDAIEAVARFEPAVVLLDLRMPHMGGIEVAQPIRAKHGTIPKLIALTGYGDEECRALTQAAGFAYHAVKPVGAEVLVSLLRLVG